MDISKKEVLLHGETTDEEMLTKIKSTTTDNNNNNEDDLLYKTDIISVVFSYLDYREMGKASMTCKDWNTIFLSDSVQTKVIKNDIRWAKYAYGNGMLDPQQVSSGDNGYYMIHILHNGWWVAISRRHKNEEEGEENEEEEEDSFDYYMDIYSMEGELINTRKVYDCVSQIASVGKLVYLNYGDQRVIQLTCINYDNDDSGTFPDQYTAERSPDLAYDETISCIVAPTLRSVVFYTIGTSIKMWDVMKVGNDDEDPAVTTVVDDLPFSCADMKLTTRDEYMIFRDNTAVIVWNLDTRDGKIMDSFNPAGVESLSVEKINNTHRLLTCHDDGSIRIYSIENENLLFSCYGGYSGPCFVRFSPDDGGRLFSVANSPTSYLSFSIKVWKVCLDKHEKISLILQETIHHLQHFRCIVDMEILPDGRLLTYGTEEELDIFNLDYHSTNNKIMIW